MPNAPAGFATATWTPVRCSECSGRVTELCSNGPVTTRSFGLINPFSAMFSASVQFLSVMAIAAVLCTVVMDGRELEALDGRDRDVRNDA